MKFTSKVTYKADSKFIDNLYDIFRYEDKEFSNERALYTVKREKNELRLTIHAADAVAFRAVTNTISKIIKIAEKTRELVKEVL